jgi:hypothetical protein
MVFIKIDLYTYHTFVYLGAIRAKIGYIIVYIRPIFEYASEVWDNCGVGNSNKLDQLQLEAARIVTGTFLH